MQTECFETAFNMYNILLPGRSNLDSSKACSSETIQISNLKTIHDDFTLNMLYGRLELFREGVASSTPVLQSRLPHQHRFLLAPRPSASHLHIPTQSLKTSLSPSSSCHECAFHPIKSQTLQYPQAPQSSPHSPDVPRSISRMYHPPRAVSRGRSSAAGRSASFIQRSSAIR